MILSVAIKKANGIGDYVGTGVVKIVRIKRGHPNLEVILQIDALDPLNRKELQDVPRRNIQYCNSLDLRIRYNNLNIISEISAIQEHMESRAEVFRSG